MEPKTNHFHPFPTGKASSSPRPFSWGAACLVEQVQHHWRGWEKLVPCDLSGTVPRSDWVPGGYPVIMATAMANHLLWELLGLVAGSSKRMDTLWHDWQQKSRKKLKSEVEMEKSI
jgi:hypothetical protein